MITRRTRLVNELCRMATIVCFSLTLGQGIREGLSWTLAGALFAAFLLYGALMVRATLLRLF